jgi:hypothetical protein
MPRDFDISPYFAIVKPTIERGFDYTRLHWADKPKPLAEVADDSDPFPTGILQTDEAPPSPAEQIRSAVNHIDRTPESVD